MKRYLFTLIVLCLSINMFGYDKTENLLVNGDFSSGLEGWKTVVSSTSQYSRIWVENGNCNFSAGSSHASSYYKCKIYQILKLQPGKYKCSFNFTGSLSYWGGSKIFYILASEDDSFDTSWGTDDELLLRETKEDSEDFDSEYSFTLNKESYIMFSLSVDACYANTVISDCKITRESVFLEPEARSYEKLYGDDNPEFEVVYNGVVDGDESLLREHFHVNLECSADKLSNVGEYPIILSCTGSMDGYEIKKCINGTLTISKSPIYVSCNDMEREYGDPNPIPTISYDGFKNGEDKDVFLKSAVYNINAIPSSNVGTYAITLSGASSKNYKFEYIDATLTIKKAPLSGKINDCTKIYGEYNPAFSISFVGLKNGENQPKWNLQPKFFTEADKYSYVGSYAVSVDECDATNYNIINIEDGVLNITRRNLIITANDSERSYFEENPQFDFRVTGFVNGDGVNSFEKQPILSTGANKYSNVGSYPIDIHGAESLNYSISYTRGSLKINKRIATITADNLSRPYKGNNPPLTYTISGFVNNDTEAVLSVTPTIETTADLMSDCGNYSITVSNAEADNYKFDYVPGTLSITRIDQAIIWNQTFSDIKIGDQVELLAYTDSGLEITYLIEGNVSEYKSGDRTFLDCIGVGLVNIRATQDGDKNYNAAVRVAKSFTVSEQASVDEIDNDDPSVKIYIQDGIIYCSMLNEKTIDIFNSDGRIIYHGKPQDINVGYGLFIVKIRDKAYKILSTM